MLQEIESRLREHAQAAGTPANQRFERLYPETLHAILLLPTHDGVVVGSHKQPGPDDPGPDRLTPFTVPGMATGPLPTLKALLALPHGKAIRGQTPGDDLILWQMVAQFVRDLMALGDYLPGLADRRAAWVPALDFPEHRRRLDGLAAAMPPSCRAGAGRSGRLPDPEEILRDFIATLVDTCVVALDNTALGAVGASSPWITSLYNDRQDGRTTVWRATPEFTDDWSRWAKPVRGEAAGQAARTCLRLEAPEVGEIRHDGAYNGHGWRLSFHLQSTVDESLIVPAREVWETRSRTLRRMDQRFEAPQERLLSDLARAAQVYEPISRALQESRPEAIELDPAEARAFVAESGQRLRHEGFGVLLPSWDKAQNNAGGGIKLHMKLKPKGGSTGPSLVAGTVGLDAMCEFNWEISLGGERLDAEEFRRLASLKVPLVEHRGKWLVFDPDAAAKTLEFLDSPDAKGEASLGTLMRHSLGLEPGTLGLGGGEADAAPKPAVPIGDAEAEGWLKAVFERLQSDVGGVHSDPSKYFVGKLRPYQKQGLAWLRYLDGFGLGGCLADDMGLGKTVQILALLAADIEAAMAGETVGPTLLVCPTSVMGNWQREARRFVPNLRVRLRHGPQRLRGAAFERDAKRMHLVIVSYGLADRDREEIARVPWRRIILDEAQNIKNPTTRQHLAVKMLKAQTRFALTGTPVENRLSELWSIYDFLMPGHLGTMASFNRRFGRPIQQEKDTQASALLRRLTGPFLLRRQKTDPEIVGDLPEKQEAKVFCGLTREQATLYQAVVDQMALEVRDTSGVQRKGVVLNSLLRLKQICNHPVQFLKDGSEVGARSGKLVRLMEMLEEVFEENARALVFTQFKEMGDIISKQLRDRLGIEAPFLHGGVSREARDEMVDRFQNGGAGAPPVLILSLKAGGTGLNLTSASHVFHFDRWWNPAVEDQATDRAFRIGQKRNVLVHKFVCQGTVEELIDQMISSKRDLAGQVVGSGEDFFTEMSVDELREAFSLREDAVEDDD